VGLADDHGAGRTEPGDDLGVDGLGLRVGVAAVGGDLAGDVHVVLDGHDDAVERPGAVAAARVGRVGLGQRLLAEHDAVGVQQRIQACDPAEVELRQGARGDLPGGDQVRVPGEAGEGEVSVIHADRTLPAGL
jgi:hypothetical protein